MSESQVKRAVWLRDFGYKTPAIAAEYGVTVKELDRCIKAYRRLGYQRKEKMLAEERRRRKARERKLARELAIRKAVARGLTAREAAIVFGMGYSTVKALLATSR